MNNPSPQEANAERHYLLLTAAIFIGLFGIYSRFLGDGPIFSIVPNILFVLGALIALKSIFSILK